MKRYSLVLIASAALFAAIAAEAAPGEAPAPLLNPRVVAAGRVEPVSEEVRLGSAITGKLEAVLVDEGDRVHSGQVVARLESADLCARVAEAEATVRLKEAELARLLNGARPEERREARAAVQEAEAVVEQTRYAFDRHRALGRKGWSSQETLEATIHHLFCAYSAAAIVMAVFLRSFLM